MRTYLHADHSSSLPLTCTEPRLNSSFVCLVSAHSQLSLSFVWDNILIQGILSCRKITPWLTYDLFALITLPQTLVILPSWHFLVPFCHERSSLSTMLAAPFFTVVSLLPFSPYLTSCLCPLLAGHITVAFIIPYSSVFIWGTLIPNSVEASFSAVSKFHCVWSILEIIPSLARVTSQDISLFKKVSEPVFDNMGNMQKSLLFNPRRERNSSFSLFNPTPLFFLSSPILSLFLERCERSASL